jgi:aspartokinase/homoserine dehydrogenase 1
LPLGQNERMSLQADIDRLLFDMLDRCQQLSDRPDDLPKAESIDAVIGVGERLSARIVAALLRQNGLRGVAIDGTDIVITDNIYGNATPNLPLTRERITSMLLPMLDRKIIPVITGFIGATATGKPTTLGRGGSDYSATILATCTDALEVWIWTDVDGIMSADPRDVEHARVIPQLTYTEAAELSNFGARLLHVRMIAPLQEHHIPLRVRNIFKPQNAGTLISDFVDSEPRLKAVASANGLGLVAPHGGSPHIIMARVDEALFAVSGTHVDVVFTAQSSWRSFVAVVIPTSAGPDAIHMLAAALDKRTEPDLGGWTASSVSIVTAVGSRLRDLSSALSEMLLSLEGLPSQASFSIVVDAENGDDALSRIHAVVEQFNSG